MKDIDFDELDKAVNSLMAGVPKSQAQSEPAEKTVDIPTTSDSQTASLSSPISVNSGSKVSEPSKPASPALQVAPASRRGGRFMDVVHPSSSMKKPEVSRPISRQGATIAPRTPVVDAVDGDRPSARPSQSMPSPTPLTSSSTSTPSLPRDTAPKSDWPDPLEVAGFEEKDADTPVLSQPVEKTVKPEEVEEPPKQTTELPLTSPFLPDTKVEKRPLGGNVNEETDKSAEKDLPVVVDDDQLPAKTDDVKPVLPAELHSDLVAIESDTTGEKEEDEQKADTSPPVVEPIPPPKPELEEKPKEPVVPAAPASIPQQYREEPSSGDQKNGAIYDTANYHQPLAHPAKQKSGWMWIIWILLILIIGAGAGAALYFFRII